MRFSLLKKHGFDMFGGIITRQTPLEEKNQMYRIFLDIEKFIRIPHRAMNAFESIGV